MPFIASVSLYYTPFGFLLLKRPSRFELSCNSNACFRSCTALTNSICLFFLLSASFGRTAFCVDYFSIKSFSISSSLSSIEPLNTQLCESSPNVAINHPGRLANQFALFPLLQIPSCCSYLSLNPLNVLLIRVAH